MKVHPIFKFSCLSVLLMTLLSGSVFADFDATQFALQFNGLNNGQGFRYNYTTANGSIVGTGSELQLSNQAGTAPVDFSAYSPSHYTGGANYMRTFCIEPNVSTIANSGMADLNYQNGQTRTSSGFAVKLGTAVLYSQFAGGHLNNFTYTSIGRNADYSALKSAIQATMGLAGFENYNWSANRYLSQLLSLNSDKNYWKGAYDPNKYYQEVGDYAVYAMNVYNNNGGNTQDFLYVTQATYSNNNGGPDPSVPEPATILLWSLGALGVAGTSWRRRYCKKNKSSRCDH